ncbi:RES domain-containing protein [Hymenobacter coccineus]|uniref:RES domain-containing protein n=1 Tax=Hymenobacter coccineus TaxID=1908235 RepID=UPI000F789628|nr:RES domain-containing protein [Hymenobacter coccineus]
MTDSDILQIEFKTLCELLNPAEFDVPITWDDSQSKTDMYLDFLYKRLDKYRGFYWQKLRDYISSMTYPVDPEFERKTFRLSSVSVEVINYYYQGDLILATNEFNKTLNEANLFQRVTDNPILTGANFYRARVANDSRFTRKDLFHIPFQSRHLINTTRYSIPGYPALYLGSSVYVCWEEFDQQPISKIHFSRFSNKRPLHVIRLQRLSDVMEYINTSVPHVYDKITYLLEYIKIFPLILACSYRAKHNKAAFKAEYVIPQLLLQYVVKSPEIDGIMFPSTKVNYNNIEGITAYNYVFPVKTYAPEGFCRKLVDTFEMTEPTSTEIEALLHTSGIIFRNEGFVNPMPGTISLVEGIKSTYLTTAFGRLQETIDKRELGPVSAL